MVSTTVRDSGSSPKSVESRPNDVWRVDCVAATRSLGKLAAVLVHQPWTPLQHRAGNRHRLLPSPSPYGLLPRLHSNRTETRLDTSSVQHPPEQLCDESGYSQI